MKIRLSLMILLPLFLMVVLPQTLYGHAGDGSLSIRQARSRTTPVIS